MEQCSSLEANRSVTSQEISRILWNPKVINNIHMHPPPVPILTRSFQSVPSIPLLADTLNIVFPPVAMSYKWPLSIRCPTKSLYALIFFSSTRPMHYPSHSSNLINRIIFDEYKYSKGNKTVPGKVATTHTEDGHKQDT